MNKKTKMILGFGFLGLSAALSAGVYFYVNSIKPDLPFAEGRNFRIIDSPYKSDVNVVDNFYLLNCNTCYMFEKILRDSSKDGGYQVNKIHATTNEKWIEHSKLDTSFRILDRIDLVDAFYDAVNKDKELIGDQSKINDFLDANGVDRSSYWSIYNSPSSLAKSLELSANSSAVDIRVVPTFVVSGKYKILLGSLKNNNELTSLIEYLIINQPEHDPDLDNQEGN